MPATSCHSAVAQFLAVCSASILAEQLRMPSRLSRQSLENKGASSRSTHAHIYQLHPTTNSDKLSDGGTQHAAYMTLEKIRAEQMEEPDEDRVLELMDFVAGFCAQDQKIWDEILVG
jgi:hypothetical protein